MPFICFGHHRKGTSESGTKPNTPNNINSSLLEDPTVVPIDF